MLKGFVEIKSSDRVAGWVWDSANPTLRLTICVRSEGALVAQGVADIFRRDLLKAGIGLGAHGFDIILKDVVSPESIEIVSLDDQGIEKTLHQWHGIPEAPRDRGFLLSLQEPPGIMIKDESHTPVFILGSARSATTIVAQSLLFCTKYKGREEGHTFHMIAPLINTIRSHYSSHAEEWNSGRLTMLADVGPDFFIGHIKAAFISLVRTMYPRGYWIDKTPAPEMIALVPVLAEMWPSARFVFMKRRGIENVASRMRKFRTLDFEFHCDEWSQCMHLWSAVRESVRGRAIEIDQVALVLETSKVARELSTILGLTSEECGKIEQYFLQNSPEKTSDTTHDLSLDSLNWSQSRKEFFTRTCSRAMEIYGYGFAADYFRKGCESGVVRLN